MPTFQNCTNSLCILFARCTSITRNTIVYTGSFFSRFQLQRGASGGRPTARHESWTRDCVRVRLEDRRDSRRSWKESGTGWPNAAYLIILFGWVRNRYAITSLKRFDRKDSSVANCCLGCSCSDYGCVWVLETTCWDTVFCSVINYRYVTTVCMRRVVFIILWNWQFTVHVHVLRSCDFYQMWSFRPCSNDYTSTVQQQWFRISLFSLKFVRVRTIWRHYNIFHLKF